MISCLIFSAIMATAALAAMWDTGPLQAVRGTLRAVLDRLWLAAAAWLADKPGEPCAWCPDPGDIDDDDLDLDELAEALADKAGGAPVPEDGKPLTFREERALSAVDMDAMLTIPEPVYPAGESDG